MPLEGFTKGRVYMVLGLYVVALIIGLWKMYKPKGFRIPEYREFKEDTGELPNSVLLRLRDDYRESAERYNQSRKEKKAQLDVKKMEYDNKGEFETSQSVEKKMSERRRCMVR